MKLNWGHGIFLFFVAFISLATVFIIFSLRQNNDLVTDDYYEKGANYDHQIDIADRSAVYNDSIKISNQNISIVAKFSKSVCQMTDTMQIYFYRPSDKRFDFKFQGLLCSDSLMINKDHLINGRYKVKFQWFHGKECYQVEKEFYNW